MSAPEARPALVSLRELAVMLGISGTRLHQRLRQIGWQPHRLGAGATAPAFFYADEIPEVIAAIEAVRLAPGQRRSQS